MQAVDTLNFVLGFDLVLGVQEHPYHRCALFAVYQC
jgi:hypothetical protein